MSVDIGEKCKTGMKFMQVHLGHEQTWEWCNTEIGVSNKYSDRSKQLAGLWQKSVNTKHWNSQYVSQNIKHNVMVRVLAAAVYESHKTEAKIVEFSELFSVLKEW